MEDGFLQKLKIARGFEGLQKIAREGSAQIHRSLLVILGTLCDESKTPVIIGFRGVGFHVDSDIA